LNPRAGNVRSLAAGVVDRTLTTRGPADHLLQRVEADLRPLDRGLLRELVLGTLRWLRRLDAVVEAASSRRLQAIERRDFLQDLLALDSDTRVETARDGFLYVRAGDGTAMRFYYYPYPLVQAEESFAEMAVASPVDLGLMKLGAVISRGTRRDFIDLFLLCQEVPLAALLERSLDKFGHVRDFPLQALKGLADLSQSEGEAIPKLSRPVSWEEVEGWLHGEVRSVSRQYVGLDPPAKE